MTADRYLNRVEAAAFLMERFKHGSAKTLARLATQGGGPKFRKSSGRLVLYSESDLIAWGESKLGKLQTSTAQNTIKKTKPTGFMANRKVGAGASA
jgi:hypothetical protein